MKLWMHSNTNWVILTRNDQALAGLCALYFHVELVHDCGWQFQPLTIQLHGRISTHSAQVQQNKLGIRQFGCSLLWKRKIVKKTVPLLRIPTQWFHSSKDIWQTYMYNCQITSFANQYGQVGTQNKTYLPISPPPQPTLQDVRITEYRCTIVLISMFTILSFFFWVMNIQRISIFTKAKILFPKSKDLDFLSKILLKSYNTHVLPSSFPVSTATSLPFQAQCYQNCHL